ncbi:MAG: branched-chain amino acid ABC transporter permease [Eubacteriales bacterium]
MANRILKKAFSKNAVTLYFVIALYAVVSILLYGGMIGRQITNMLIPVSCYIVLAVSLNLVVGLLGELSLGHAGFMSVGLFSGCLLSIALANTLPMIIRLPISMIFGGLFAAAVGFVVGLPALRLNGDYLAIVTLACGEIIKNIMNNLSITGGALGLDMNSEKGNIYSKPKELLPYAIALVLITVIVMMNIKKSRHGRAIMAIRDNKIASEATGINVTYYKLVVFMLAAFFAGAAGVLYGHAFANIRPTTFNYNMSIEILIIVVFGGMGSINGSIIAAIALRVLSEATREFGEYRMLAYSILLIVIMLLNNNPKFAELKSGLSLKKLFSKKKGGTVNG